MISIIAACTAPPAVPGLTDPAGAAAVIPTEDNSPSQTPFQPLPPTSTPSPTPEPDLSIWVSPAVPAQFESQITFPVDIPRRETAQEAALWISLDQEPAAGNIEGMVEVSSTPWVFALVAPFPTIPDGVTLESLRAAWKGGGSDLFGSSPLLMDQRTGSALNALWGPSGLDSVSFLPAEEILEYAWDHRPSWAIVPFEELEPRWKVLQIDGVSPIAKEFDPAAYPLTFAYRLWSRPGSLDVLISRLEAEEISSMLPPANRDPNRLSVVVVTGVTALVRATAWMMVTRGIEFPARDVGDLLREADITHISNEVAFAPDCPVPNPNSSSLRFCSNPDHLELLEYIGADVVELSGNHVNDWGAENLAFSLQLYRDAGIEYYAGGDNLQDSRRTVLFEHNGNRIAFVGCNPAGPGYAWATDSRAGSASCEGDWLPAEIARLASEGYLPIATLQFDESYDPVPLPRQVTAFQSLAEAGAVIVSGSQAHYPQALGFSGDHLIHFGLGNLFFDQMYYNGLGPGTRWEFIDRHIFYGGRLVSTELITAMLEEYARPRLMTPEERAALLELIFQASGW